MQYNVSQLLKEGTGAMRNYDLHEEIASLDTDFKPLTTLDGKIQMIRTMDGILVRGNLHCSLELVCSRCLEPFAAPLKFTLEEEFHSTIDIVTGAHLPVEQVEDSATLIDERHTLDLSEVARQDLLLAMPPVPVCRSSCAGLCPTCGQNRNYEKCDHAGAEIDPHLEKLGELLKD